MLSLFLDRGIAAGHRGNTKYSALTTTLRTLATIESQYNFELSRIFWSEQPASFPRLQIAMEARLLISHTKFEVHFESDQNEIEFNYVNFIQFNFILNLLCKATHAHWNLQTVHLEM